jgi:hypothetical protein
MPITLHRLRFLSEVNYKKAGLSQYLTANFSTTVPNCNRNQNLKSWERGARLVKNTKVQNNYLEHIRASHDPSLHVKTIEDELKGTIGKALGKQGEKVRTYLKAMDQERQRYELLLQDHQITDPKVIATAKQYNEHRRKCLHARWELMVHRQAVGFIVGNHKYVVETFPIGDSLPIAGEHGNDE